MAITEFPVGQTLTAVSIVEYKKICGEEICRDLVKLFFQNTTVTLLPLIDSDEIEVIQEITTAPTPVDTPSWYNDET